MHEASIRRTPLVKVTSGSKSMVMVVGVKNSKGVDSWKLSMLGSSLANMLRQLPLFELQPAMGGENVKEINSKI